MKLGGVNRWISVVLIFQIAWGGGAGCGSRGAPAGVPSHSDFEIGQEDFVDDRVRSPEENLESVLGRMSEGYALIKQNSSVRIGRNIVLANSVYAIRNIIQRYREVLNRGMNDSERDGFERFLTEDYNPLIHSLALAEIIAMHTRDPSLREAVFASTFREKPNLDQFMGTRVENFPGDPRGVVILPHQERIIHSSAAQSPLGVGDLANLVQQTASMIGTFSRSHRASVEEFKERFQLEIYRGAFQKYWFYQGMYLRPIPSDEVAIREFPLIRAALARLGLERVMRDSVQSTRSSLGFLGRENTAVAETVRRMNRENLLARLNEARSRIQQWEALYDRVAHARARSGLVLIEDILQSYPRAPGSVVGGNLDLGAQPTQTWLRVQSAVVLLAGLEPVPRNQCFPDGKVTVPVNRQESLLAIFHLLAPGRGEAYRDQFLNYLERCRPLPVQGAAVGAAGSESSTVLCDGMASDPRVRQALDPEHRVPGEERWRARPAPAPLPLARREDGCGFDRRNFFFRFVRSVVDIEAGYEPGFAESIRQRIQDRIRLDIRTEPLLAAPVFERFQSGDGRHRPFTMQELETALQAQLPEATDRVMERAFMVDFDDQGQSSAPSPLTRAARLMKMNPEIGWKIAAGDGRFLQPMLDTYPEMDRLRNAEELQQQRSVGVALVAMGAALVIGVGGWAGVGLGVIRAGRMAQATSLLLEATTVVSAVNFISEWTQYETLRGDLQGTRNQILAGLGSIRQMREAERMFRELETRSFILVLSGVFVMADAALVFRGIRTLEALASRIARLRELERSYFALLQRDAAAAAPEEMTQILRTVFGSQETGTDQMVALQRIAREALGEGAGGGAGRGRFGSHAEWLADLMRRSSARGAVRPAIEEWLALVYSHPQSAMGSLIPRFFSQGWTYRTGRWMERLILAALRRSGPESGVGTLNWMARFSREMGLKRLILDRPIFTTVDQAQAWLRNVNQLIGRAMVQDLEPSIGRAIGQSLNAFGEGLTERQFRMPLVRYYFEQVEHYLKNVNELNAVLRSERGIFWRTSRASVSQSGRVRPAIPWFIDQNIDLIPFLRTPAQLAAVRRNAAAMAFLAKTVIGAVGVYFTVDPIYGALRDAEEAMTASSLPPSEQTIRLVQGLMQNAQGLRPYENQVGTAREYQRMRLMLIRDIRYLEVCQVTGRCQPQLRACGTDSECEAKLIREITDLSAILIEQGWDTETEAAIPIHTQEMLREYVQRLHRELRVRQLPNYLDND